MTTCTTKIQSGLAWLDVNGRIDSMSSTNIQRQFDELILSGSRLIVVNLEQVHFVSSAGLRVFLVAQKQLNKVGGEIILFKAPENVLNVLTMAGFDQICKIIANEEQLAAVSSVGADAAEITATTVDGITFKHRETPGASQGSLRIIGSQDPLSSAGYTENDVATIPQAELRFGLGLATMGERYEEYKHLFGEALIMNSHFYFYPAIKRPTVDYMFYSGKDAGTDCRFFHGFHFDGPYRYIASFETEKNFVTLDRLIEWTRSLTFSTPLLGFVLLAESKGFFGMNLKQIPIPENKPAQVEDIFEVSQVTSWINFPVDPTDQNHIIAATGIVCRDKAACSADVQKLFSSESVTHIHAGVFEKGPVSKNIDQFPGELNRVLTELEILRVQHVLGQSRFSNGMLGLIELKG